MKLSEQVVSLDLAKQLKELGFEQESQFYYFPADGPLLGLNIDKDKVLAIDELERGSYHVYRKSDNAGWAAYTVAELGEMLHGYTAYTYPARNGRNRWQVVVHSNSKRPSCYEEAPSEADARAKALIWLKENGYLPVSEL